MLHLQRQLLMWNRLIPRKSFRHKQPLVMMKAIDLKQLLFVLFLLVSLQLLNAQKIGYALSGGGARGFAHIGVLKVLEEEGVKPDYIAGSSIGAIIGALSTMGYSAIEIEDICVRLDWEYLTQDIQS